jgi:hypothetical protein
MGPGLTLVDLPEAVADALISIARTSPRTAAPAPELDSQSPAELTQADLVRMLSRAMHDHGQEMGLSRARHLPLFEQRRLALRLPIELLMAAAVSINARRA